MKQGSGLGKEKDKEHEKDLHPAVEFPEVEVCLTAVVLAGRHLILKLPYRTCSIGLIWTLGCCPTQVGAKHRSDKTQPGTLRSMQDRVKVDLHQLHQNTHLLLVVLLSILVDLGP